MDKQRYMMRGVSAAKEDVHNAIKNIDKGIFPKAFCKIIPDILGGDPDYCNIMLPMELAPSRRWPTFIGKKRVTSVCGKVLLRMH